MPSYSAVHESPRGPGDARPTADQIVQNEAIEGEWADKIILITGCSSGLGVETARTLHKTGATLYLTIRDVAKAKATLGSLLESDRVHLLTLDLNSLESVRACASDFLSKSKTLNILIENAGVMTTPEGRTKDGFETQFGTNHLAHFLLFLLLKPTLLASSTPKFASRVVILSSVGHRISEVHFDNINLDGEYEPWKAYGQSKTASLWTANQIERKYGSRGLHAFSLHPGSIATELSRHMTADDLAGAAADQTFANMMKSAQQGAATTVWAAAAKELEGTGGRYLENCQVSKPYQPSAGQWGPGHAPWAYDSEKEAKMWSLSLKLLGMADDA
ncbi:short-chain dehydrogenase/reductase-like protein [Cadophora sp. DSE1049]|nr:short-chain dehydrogenase/reductase-like protein [Cadophora sp. DSE1049]